MIPKVLQKHINGIPNTHGSEMDDTESTSVFTGSGAHWEGTGLTPKWCSGVTGFAAHASALFSGTCSSPRYLHAPKHLGRLHWGA